MTRGRSRTTDRPSFSTTESLDLVFRWLDDLRHERQLSEHTIYQYGMRIEWLERLFCKPVTDISAEDLRQMKREARTSLPPTLPGAGEFKWPQSSSALKGAMVAIRQFHSWGAGCGLWPAGAILHVHPPREENENIPPLSLHTATTCLRRAEGSLETRMVYLGLYAGLRREEAALIEEKHWQDGWLRFRGGKNRQWREVPVHPDLELVRDLIFEIPVPHRESLPKAVKRLSDRMGVPLRTHQFRKTFATFLYDAEGEGRTVQELLGHGGDVSSRYIIISRRRKRDTILLLPYPSTRRAESVSREVIVHEAFKPPPLGAVVVGDDPGETHYLYDLTWGCWHAMAYKWSNGSGLVAECGSLAVKAPGRVALDLSGRQSRQEQEICRVCLPDMAVPPVIEAV